MFFGTALTPTFRYYYNELIKFGMRDTLKVSFDRFLLFFLLAVKNWFSLDVSKIGEQVDLVEKN